MIRKTVEIRGGILATLVVLAALGHGEERASVPGIATASEHGAIHTLRAEAHVTVSDGLEYDVVTLFHDPQRAIFRRTYPDRQVTLGVDGKYYWSFDGAAETEGPEVYETIVLGHQFHAQILFFDRLHAPLAPPEEVPCGEARCLAYSGPRGHSLRVDAETRRPVELVLAREDGPPIQVAFDRWREVDGFELPFRLTIDDGERVFDYDYRAVAFNQGSLDDLRAPVEVLTDEQKLLRLHRKAMDAHFFEDPSMLKGYFGPEGVVAFNGEVVPVTGADSEAMMERIFSSRDHTRYDDLIRPIVEVSDDGSLGWVIVQVEATGVLFDESGAPAGPLQFTSAWISLHRKQDGEWRQIGNVSNFKPEPE